MIYEEPHELLLEDDEPHTKYLTGLARTCPSCGLIAHYKVSSRKPTLVSCFECDNEFMVQKYKRNQKPKSIKK